MSFSRTNLRNRQESTSTERRKLDRQATQRVPSSEMPPPGTIMWTCGWFFHCRLDADALGPSRDVPDSLLEPVQRFRRNRALDVRTSRKAEPFTSIRLGRGLSPPSY